ncbi:hypothetical protein GIB67_041667 [Kingdonia uniflora]|uniref:Uncharacterized protein n=1 Tax=Kingdonia uniflora TaxID=39325 RepID=A0A7J7MQQ3_9MAGN|nr:hypothetical protein GIB67_041667 [Kingdonia uniflora]
MPFRWNIFAPSVIHSGLVLLLVLSRPYGFADVSNNTLRNSQVDSQKPFASLITGQEKPFDFLHVLFGSTAGAVVEAALYPIDSIETRLQAAYSLFTAGIGGEGAFADGSSADKVNLWGTFLRSDAAKKSCEGIARCFRALLLKCFSGL